MAEEDDDDAVRDLDGNVLMDPDKTWQFYCSPESCSKCGNRFNLSSDHEFHTPCFQIPSRGSIMCSFDGCSLMFPDLKRVRAHYNDCHEIVESFYCVLCTFRCCSYERIMEHKWSSHQAKKLLEPVDQETFEELDTSVVENGSIDSGISSASNFNLVKMYEVTRSRLKCYECHKSFDQVHQLVLHDPCFERNGSLSYCDECSLHFDSASAFKTHLQTLHDIEIYHCCQCRAGFKIEGDLKSHLKECLK